MSEIAIRVEGLSKRYRIVALQQRYDTLRDQIADAFTAPFRRIAAAARGQPSAVRGQDEIIWALKDVSFEASP